MKKLFSLCTSLAALLLQLAFAMIFFQPVLADDFELADEFLEGSSSTQFVIDTEDEAGAGQFITLQFGESIGETLVWDIDNSRFAFSDSVRIEGNNAIVGQLFVADDHQASDSDGFINLGKNNGTFESISWNDTGDSFSFSDDIDLNLNQLIETRIENLASEPTCDAASRGRLYHNTTNDNSFVCNGTSYIQIDSTGGGGGNGDAEYFDAYDSAGGSSIDGGFTDIQLNTERQETSAFTHSGGNASVTINTTGTYIVSYTVSTQVSNGNNRSESEGRLVLDQGGGFNEISGSIMRLYNRQSTQGESTATRTLILDLNAGDNIKIQARRFSGGSNITTLAEGSSLSIFTAGGGSGGGSITYDDLPTRLKTIGLSPEYAGAVFEPDGSNNSGSFDARFDGTNFHNYYEWSTTQGQLQDFNIVIRTQVPLDFDSWDDSLVHFSYRTAEGSTNNNRIELSMFDTNNNSAALQNATNLANANWTTYTQSNPNINNNNTFTPGEYFTLIVKVFAANAGEAHAGEITFRYNGK